MPKGALGAHLFQPEHPDNLVLEPYKPVSRLHVLCLRPVELNVLGACPVGLVDA